MDGREFIHDVIIVAAYILIFLGVQVYAQEYIKKWPWAFIAIGLILFTQARKISGYGQ